jgi:hypothetical protein
VTPEEYQELIDLLRHFHKQPEVGLATRANIREYVAKLQVEQEKAKRAERITSAGY